MKALKESNHRIGTFLAFAIIPISGFALDVYIPSLPDMAAKLHTDQSSVQLTLSIFLITYGLGQLLVGGILDSYGRYLPNLVGLAGFIVTSIIIANTGNLYVIYAMRALQGIAAAIVIVSKRAFFFDLYTGEKLKSFASLFSVIWASAPIIAPFLGGYLQTHFGWQSNFYFLALFGLVFLILELVFSGETLKSRTSFNYKGIGKTYWSMLRAADFTAGLLILGLSYGMLMVYNMASPFIIEKLLHYPPTVTGNCSLLSGLAVLAGGTVSKIFISRPLFKKMLLSIGLQIVVVITLMTVTFQTQSLYTLMAYVILLHSLAGFIFNGMLAYCMTRFSHHGGLANGLAGGGYIIFTSALSYSVVSSITITSQFWLGVAYSVLIAGVLTLVLKVKWKDQAAVARAEKQPEIALSE
ncbi:MFS transporter [Pedobacter ginsengisoli]|uniref:MFS transporter n=1 Tax=Pedobacter ginsengisoli TaxID=363852 RepID=UPI00254A36DE|nr:MFS transporter [Pedobacter ginsengisoli]